MWKMLLLIASLALSAAACKITYDEPLRDHDPDSHQDVAEPSGADSGSGEGGAR